jgi:ABC-2 type transport system permease protein
MPRGRSRDVDKILKVVRREWVERVRKKSFLITTVVMPILGFGLFFLVGALVAITPPEQVHVVVVDRSGFVAGGLSEALDDTLKGGVPRFVLERYGEPGRDLDALKADLNHRIDRGEIDSYLFVPEDVVDSGKVQYFGRKVSNIETIEDLEDGLTEVVAGRRLEEKGLEYEEVRRLSAGVNIETRKISAGEEKAGGFLQDYVSTYILVVFIFMTILIWGQVMMRSVIEEKSSRVMEVLVSSVTPTELMVGKIVGISMVTLTQYAIWFALLMSGFGLAVSSGLPVFDFVTFSATTVVAFGVFFLFGFLIYSTLFAAVGSVCNTEQDAQNLQQPITWSLLIPYIMPFFVIQNPDSTVAVVLSLIPFFSPILMFMRINVLTPPAWQIALSLALMSATLYVLWRGSAKVFRIGVLMYGKRPGVREILRWARAG